MINRRLSSDEAAETLGVKRATLYAYVSRGLLTRERESSGSTFDPSEVARLARTARHPGRRSRAGGRETRTSGSLAGAGEPMFVTELTLIEGGRLYYRGLDAIELSRTRTFEEVAGWLWTAGWPPAGERWDAPDVAEAAVSAVLAAVGEEALPIERFMVATMAAGLSDDLRHDLNPAGVPVTGRRLLSTLVEALPPADAAATRPSRAKPSASLSERLWPRLSPLPLTEPRRAVLEAALVLVADHELAPSTMAVRVAAALRADPYAAVLTGMGPASGSWYAGSTGAPSEVEHLLAEAFDSDPERSIGQRLRRTGSTPHGFGMPLYPQGDPRGSELLRRLDELDADPARSAIVERVLELASHRGFPAPNVDLGLGALAFCAEMVPGAGQAISTFGKVAGWLAHTMEEYAHPTRFRSRADYVGTWPDSEG